MILQFLRLDCRRSLQSDKLQIPALVLFSDNVISRVLCLRTNPACVFVLEIRVGKGMI